MIKASKIMDKKNVIICDGIEYGDYVVCSNCGAVMLVPCGEDICPMCHEDGCLMWADDEQEHNASDFE